MTLQEHLKECGCVTGVILSSVRLGQEKWGLMLSCVWVHCGNGTVSWSSAHSQRREHKTPYGGVVPVERKLK